MDKLTQFVSKSFENNNNNSVINSEHNSKMRTDSPILESYIKSENDVLQQCDSKNSEDDSSRDQRENLKPTPVAKNWLISDAPKHSVPSYGIDLRLNNNPNVIYTSSLIVNTNRSNNLENCTTTDTDKLCSVSSLVPKVKWYENSIEMKSPSPKNSYSSSSSPIDLEDSKSCPETLISEKHNDDGATNLIPKENNMDNDKKICEFKSMLLLFNFPSRFAEKACDGHTLKLL